MSPFVDVLIIIIASVIITVIYELIKSRVPALDHDTQDIVNYGAAFIGLFVTLLLTFTISNYLSRYGNLVENVSQDASELAVIIRYMKVLPNSDPVLQSIRNYVDYLNDNPDNIQKIYDLYSEINKNIIQYVKSNTTPFNDEILSRIRANQAISRSFDLYNIVNDFLFIISLFFLILTLIVFLFIRVPVKWVQYAIDFCIIAVVVGSMYIIYKLNQQYVNIAKIQPNPYQFIISLLDEP